MEIKTLWQLLKNCEAYSATTVVTYDNDWSRFTSINILTMTIQIKIICWLIKWILEDKELDVTIKDLIEQWLIQKEDIEKLQKLFDEICLPTKIIY